MSSSMRLRAAPVTCHGKNLKPVDNVGVLTFSFTTQSDRTALWSIDHQHELCAILGDAA